MYYTVFVANECILGSVEPNIGKKQIDKIRKKKKT